MEHGFPVTALLTANLEAAGGVYVEGYYRVSRIEYARKHFTEQTNVK
jgi:hypothetical protein